MSDKITNEQAYDGLLEYYFESPDHEKYEEFDGFWAGVVSMVVSKSLGWISEISDAGYAKIVEAYNELVELGFFDDGE